MQRDAPTEDLNDVAQIESKLGKDNCGELEQLLRRDSTGSQWRVKRPFSCSTGFDITSLITNNSLVGLRSFFCKQR